MKLNWELESELALKAVSAGGDLILDRSEKPSISIKESLRDVVTELDLRIEVHIAAILKTSGHPIIGEESFKPGMSLPPRTSTYWLVDPIDGTANYVAGMPFYAISAGLWAADNFATGAVSLPAFKEFFFTYGDHGAYLNGKAIQSQDAQLKHSLVAAGFSGSDGDAQFRQRQYEMFGLINDSSRGCMRLGSAASNLCYVASGRLQACYGVHNQLWDVAGGIAVALRAGCKVLFQQLLGSTRVNYIVGGPTVVDELRDLFASKELIFFDSKGA